MRREGRAICHIDNRWYEYHAASFVGRDIGAIAVATGSAQLACWVAGQWLMYWKVHWQKEFNVNDRS